MQTVLSILTVLSCKLQSKQELAY